MEKDLITKICVFDFDGTLVSTVLPDQGMEIYVKKTGQKWPHKKSWWSKPESLDMDIFDIPVVDSVIEEYNKVAFDPSVLKVMLTGRLAKLSKEVKKILEAKGLKFDHYLFNTGGATITCKIKHLSSILNEYKNVREVVCFDDRTKHMQAFLDWGAAHEDIDFKHVLILSDNHGE